MLFPLHGSRVACSDGGVTPQVGRARSLPPCLTCVLLNLVSCLISLLGCSGGLWLLRLCCHFCIERLVEPGSLYSCLLHAPPDEPHPQFRFHRSGVRRTVTTGSKNVLCPPRPFSVLWVIWHRDDHCSWLRSRQVTRLGSLTVQHSMLNRRFASCACSFYHTQKHFRRLFRAQHTRRNASRDVTP